MMNQDNNEPGVEGLDGDVSTTTPRSVRPALSVGHHAPPPASFVEAKGKGKKKNPRMGKIVPGKAGKPATFKPGDAAPANFDPKEIAEELDLWWVDGAGDKYLIKDTTSGEYSTWSERKVTKALRLMPGRMIATKQRDDERIAESEEVFIWTMRNRKLRVEFDALAGYKAGVHDFPWGKGIVKTSARIIEPVAPALPLPKDGAFPIVRAIIEDRLGPVQSVYFHSWLKIAYETLTLGKPGNFRPGQAVIFVGKVGSAKSFLQNHLITPILGGRDADPQDYMFGRTDFNNELISSEHLMMEDPINTTLTKDRVFFGERIKRTVVNEKTRIHKKTKDGMMGNTFSRLTISVNNDPDKMRVLPLITPDIIDKIMVFNVESCPLPLPSESLAERAALLDAINEELPFYIHWLLNDWKIPDDIKSVRYGVAHYQDQDLLSVLLDDTPSSELLDLVDAAVFTRDGTVRTLWELPSDSTHGYIWKGSVIDLEKLLLSEYDNWTCSMEREANKLFKHNKCLRLLQRLKEDSPLRVDQYRTNKARGWAIAQSTARVE